LGLGTAAQEATSAFQAADDGLASIAGLTTAADKMIYTTALDTYAVTSLTSAGRALLDDADAGAQRTTLGLGVMATYSDISNANWNSTDSGQLSVANGGTGAITAAAARTNLGLGVMATYSDISNANWNSTDSGQLSVANGGTGAITAAAARTNLVPTFQSSATTTIDSDGVITATKALHILESESGTTDSLSAIEAGTAGQIVYLQAKATHTITVVHNAGVTGTQKKIWLTGNGTITRTLTGDNHSVIQLIYDGTYWSEISYSAGSSDTPT
jgi:hypothetical protein